MPLIFSTHPLHPMAVERLEQAGTLQIASAPRERAILAEAADADILIVRAPIPAGLFERANKLRAAIRHGAGLDMIPVEAASAAGVLVANVPAVNAVSVAEHVFTVTLMLLRRSRAIDRDLRGTGWEAGRAHADLAHDLGGRTVGIVGFGNVGRAIHRIASAGFGLEVLTVERTNQALPAGVRAVSLDALMGEADIVVLCCPLNEETRGMIDAARIARMKPHALLINVSRGPVVEETALIAALRENRIAGAALDVFASQPVPTDHPFFGFDNVVLTPHLAGITEESMARMGLGAADETARVLAGDLPKNLVNPDVVARYRERFGA